VLRPEPHDRRAFGIGALLGMVILVASFVFWPDAPIRPWIEFFDLRLELYHDELRRSHVVVVANRGYRKRWGCDEIEATIEVIPAAGGRALKVVRTVPSYHILDIGENPAPRVITSFLVPTGALGGEEPQRARLSAVCFDVIVDTELSGVALKTQRGPQYVSEWLPLS